MFGMGFTEILIILIIAILFLGPDKLPGAMIDIAKFLKNAKNAIGSVKDSFEHEIEASGIKAEVIAYKKELESAQEQLSKVGDIKASAEASISNLSNDIFNDDKSESEIKKAPKEEQEISFKKREGSDV